MQTLALLPPPARKRPHAPPALPAACASLNAASAIFSALTSLAFVGAALAAATGATAPARFAWLFSWRRAYVWLAYAAVIPCYSALSNLPALQESLASTHRWGPGMIAAFALGERAGGAGSGRARHVRAVLA